MLAFPARIIAGHCPNCPLKSTPVGPIPEMGVIYRRSNHSITFRCNQCSLQWTVTLANLHRVAKKKAEQGGKDSMVFSALADATAFAAERATSRQNAIQRQTNRRVIRLPDRAAINES